MTNRREPYRPRLLALLVVVPAVFGLLADSRARAQSPPETKQPFVVGLMDFVAASAGLYGDEGSRLFTALASMETGLGEWDARVWVYETLIASKVEGAEPRTVADMRTLLGALLLERGRLKEALQQFDLATALDPQRADIRVFQALAYAAAGQPLEAARSLEVASELDPADPIKPYLRAQYLADANRIEEVSAPLRRVRAIVEGHLPDQNATAERRPPFIEVALLENGASANTVFAPAHYAAGFASIRQGDYERAISQLRSAAALDPLNLDPVISSDRISQGIGALRRGEFKTAIDHLRGGVELSPDSSEARRILGTAYWARQSYEASVEQLTEAIRLNPRDERSRLTLADVLVEAGQPARAAEALREAGRVIPESGQLHYRLGQLYQAQQRNAEALREFEEALRLNPVTGISALIATIGWLRLNEMNFEGAIDIFRQGTRVNQNSAEAHRQLGDAYRKQGRQDEALVEFVVALAIDPESPDAYAALGQLHVAGGRLGDGVTALQRAVALNPTHHEARYALGSALVRLGSVDEGHKELQVFERLQAEALEKERRTYEINLIRLEATLHSQEGRYSESAALWQKVVELEPTQPANHVALAQALTRAGRYDAAIDSYLEVVRLDDRAEIHRHLSELHAKLGRSDEAAREEARYEQMREAWFRGLGGVR